MKEEVKLATYASGYRRLYGNDEDEIRALTGEAAREARGGIATADWNNPVVHWWPYQTGQVHRRSGPIAKPPPGHCLHMDLCQAAAGADRAQDGVVADGHSPL